MRKSAQADAFLEKCVELGLDANAAEAEFLEWIEKTLTKQAARQLKAGFTLGKNTRDHYPQFAAFLQHRFQAEVPPEAFRGLRRSPDVFGAFAQRNLDSIGLLQACLGDWEVVRPSYRVIEAGAKPDWANALAGQFILEFKRPAKGDEVSFRFTDTVANDGWEGHAVAVHDCIFLSGVSHPERSDAVQFVLHRHPTDPTILVGTQAALFHEEDTGRAVAVSRRVAAYRNHGKSIRPRTIAQAWAEQDPMGVVVTLKEPRPRRQRD